MFNWIRAMSDLQLLSFMLIAGMIGWVTLVVGFIAMSKMWDRRTESSVYQCERLRRENARLRKKLREGAQQNAKR